MCGGKDASADHRDGIAVAAAAVEGAFVAGQEAGSVRGRRAACEDVARRVAAAVPGAAAAAAAASAADGEEEVAAPAAVAAASPGEEKGSSRR